MNLQYPTWHYVKILITVIVGSLLLAISLNYFLIPANVYASGLSGVAQLLSNILQDYTPINISMGILLFVLNIPVVILGWLKVGRAFTLYSFLSIVFTTIFLEIIPIQVQAADIFLYAVFGGVIAAVGVGITLKVGASTGGLDIIAMVLSRVNDKSVGTYFFIMNAIVIVLAGALYGWDKSLYTLVSLYATTRVIDAIHTSNQKLTVMIVTKKATELKEAIHARLVRGITIVPVKGAFSNEPKEMMMIVITRYELFEIEHLIKEVDPNAFTNIVETASVIGYFRKDK